MNGVRSVPPRPPVLLSFTMGSWSGDSESGFTEPTGGNPMHCRALELRIPTPPMIRTASRSTCPHGLTACAHGMWLGLLAVRDR